MPSSMIHSWLQNCVQSQKEYSIFLDSGVQLKGQIIAFDETALFVKKDKIISVVYQDAIASIMPFVETKE